jgi:hypothetical protein
MKDRLVNAIILSRMLFRGKFCHAAKVVALSGGGLPAVSFCRSCGTGRPSARVAGGAVLAGGVGWLRQGVGPQALGSSKKGKVLFVAEEPDSQMALMFSFYERVQRKGPGSEAPTTKALSMLDGLPPNPRVIDFGCGSGEASLVLARASQGSIAALDIYQPFLNQLEAQAARGGLADRIKTVQADMAAPPFPGGSFDLVWSEGPFISSVLSKV